MKTVRNLFVVAIVAGVPASAFADGLLYTLPADGATATFDMRFVSKKQKISGTGTLSLSSVGKAKAGGKDCRWIEFTWVIAILGQEQKIQAKILIPEEDLGKGKNPLKNPQKGWVQLPNQKVKKITDFTGTDLGPFRMFLPGALTNAMQLKPKNVDTKLGKLKCVGESGKSSIRQRSDTYDSDYESRLHAKSPFGVAYAKMMFKQIRDKDDEGIVHDEIELTFTLKSVGKNAKSKLPDQK